MSEWIKPKVEMRRAHVLKWYPRDVEIEYRKALALWELAVQEGFCAPRPLTVDTARGVIVYAHLGKMRCIREVYLDYMKAPRADQRCLELIGASGQVLAKLHKGLKLADTTEWAGTSMLFRDIEKVGGRNVQEFTKTCPQACLHTDYGFSNVAVSNQNGTDKLVVFDATANGYSSYSTAEVGPIYVDIGVFLGTLDGRVPLRHYPQMKWNRLREVKEAFLSGYEAAAQRPVDRLWASRFAYGIGLSYLRTRRCKWGPLSSLPGLLLYNSLKGNVPR